MSTKYHTAQNFISCRSAIVTHIKDRLMINFESATYSLCMGEKVTLLTLKVC